MGILKQFIKTREQLIHLENINMPLTPKGNKVIKAMRKEYGNKKGKSVFYATKNAGKLKGVD